MDCKHCEVQLDAYLDRELDKQTMAQVQAHLAECVHCQQSLAQRQRLQQLLRSAQEEAPDFITPAILRIQGQKKPRMVRRFVSAACAVVACLVLAVALPGMLGSTKQESEAYAVETKDIVYSVEEAAPEEGMLVQEEAKTAEQSAAGGNGESREGNVTLAVAHPQKLVDALTQALGAQAGQYIRETEQGYLLMQISEYQSTLEGLLAEQGAHLPEAAIEAEHLEVLSK